MDETLARRAQEALIRAAPSNWPRPWTEIQESELLLGVDLPDELGHIRLSDDERRRVALALNIIMPSDEPLGIWTVAVKCGGYVVDSVLANDA